MENSVTVLKYKNPYHSLTKLRGGREGELETLKKKISA
jgi:hypothetical protein